MISQIRTSALWMRRQERTGVHLLSVLRRFSLLTRTKHPISSLQLTGALSLCLICHSAVVYAHQHIILFTCARRQERQNLCQVSGQVSSINITAKHSRHIFVEGNSGAGRGGWVAWSYGCRCGCIYLTPDSSTDCSEETDDDNNQEEGTEEGGEKVLRTCCWARHYSCERATRQSRRRERGVRCGCIRTATYTP